MKKIFADPGIIMLLGVIVVEGITVLRLRQTLARVPVERGLTPEEETFVRFAQVVSDGYKE